MLNSAKSLESVDLEARQVLAAASELATGAEEQTVAPAHILKSRELRWPDDSTQDATLIAPNFKVPSYPIPRKRMEEASWRSDGHLGTPRQHLGRCPKPSAKPLPLWQHEHPGQHTLTSRKQFSESWHQDRVSAGGIQERTYTQQCQGSSVPGITQCPSRWRGWTAKAPQSRSPSQPWQSLGHADSPLGQNPCARTLPTGGPGCPRSRPCRPYPAPSATTQKT